eukprot:TRINITY_DN850_c0_g2_i3.p1 TRINITY_DN850_c0_g2~~TRINITY_DN850_c0_g2_i3.p1  ORF type:complete len:188 (-),score=12.41 TRINITY_DN850_c0_g2_i3:608-1171(-)
MALSFLGCARFSDLMAVSKSNVSIDESGISLYCPISKTDQLRKGRTIFLGGLPATEGSVVVVPSPSVLIPLLLRVCPENPALFPGGPVSGVINIGWLNRSIRSLVAQVIGPDAAKKFSSHSGRRGSATNAIGAGADLDLVRRMGGWAQLSSAARYMDRKEDLRHLSSHLNDQVMMGVRRSARLSAKR